jgi:hypothetical protein
MPGPERPSRAGWGEGELVACGKPNYVARSYLQVVLALKVRHQPFFMVKVKVRAKVENWAKTKDVPSFSENFELSLPRRKALDKNVPLMLM